jgi:hypothetical protein
MLCPIDIDDCINWLRVGRNWYNGGAISPNKILDQECEQRAAKQRRETACFKRIVSVHDFIFQK